MGQKILITGASGLIGSHLTDLLLQKGYQIIHLGRKERTKPVPCYKWNIEQQTLDPRALEGVTTIIHLAGAGIADARWSARRKKEILESRTHSTKLLFNTLNTEKHEVKNFISASAIGYYGFENDGKLFVEEDAPGTDFLATVVRDWEHEIDQIKKLAVRVVKVRVGIVLSEKGGALKEMVRPIRFGVGASIASGKQMLSWIHIDDLCQIFTAAVENNAMTGSYNAVTSEPVSNAELTKTAASVLKMPLWLPAVPGFALKLALGEMAGLVINGSRVSPQKLLKTGFKFRFPNLEPALVDLLGRKP